MMNDYFLILFMQNGLKKVILSIGLVHAFIFHGQANLRLGFQFGSMVHLGGSALNNINRVDGGSGAVVSLFLLEAPRE
jgi:hypothetical protein